MLPFVFFKSSLPHFNQSVLADSFRTAQEFRYCCWYRSYLVSGEDYSVVVDLAANKYRRSWLICFRAVPET